MLKAITNFFSDATEAKPIQDGSDIKEMQHAPDQMVKSLARPKAQLRPARSGLTKPNNGSSRLRNSISERELRSLGINAHDSIHKLFSNAPDNGGQQDIDPDISTTPGSGSSPKYIKRDSGKTLGNPKHTKSDAATSPDEPVARSNKKRRTSLNSSMEVGHSERLPRTQLPAAATTPTKSSLAKVRSKHKVEKIKNEDFADTKALRRECVICAEEKLVHRDFPSFRLCEHPPQTCVACITQQTFTKLQTAGTWESCTCAQCGVVMPYAQLLPALSSYNRTRAKSLVLQHTLQADEAWRWCLAPNCDGGQLHAPKTRSQTRSLTVICNKCGAKSCYFHRVPWHNGLTCEEYDDRNPAAHSVRSSEDRIKKISKACPGVGCGRRVIKDGGCDHMWCKSLDSKALKCFLPDRCFRSILRNVLALVAR